MGHHLTSVTVADRSGLTVDEALTEAHQNFTVRTVPLTTTPDDPAGQLGVPGLLATVREHPVTGDTSVLGWVSPRYRIVQNREAYLSEPRCQVPCVRLRRCGSWMQG